MLLVALAVAPGIFWLWYFLQRDRLRPEPRNLVRRVFFFGGGSAFIAGLLEVGMFAATGLSLEGRTAPPLAAAAAIGLIEEGVKFLAILVIVYRHREFNEVLDGIIYAVTASLGGLPRWRTSSTSSREVWGSASSAPSSPSPAMPSSAR